jgi:acetyl/propionyl-CoA carboxylase alpha subunit
MVVAALLVIVPFAYWYGTWFGRGLSDEQIEKYFNEGKNPRHVQHALSQIGEGVEKKREGVERWFPRVVEASGSQSADVRMTAAWVMGLEHGREDFREALLRLLADPEPIVRRNAALALVRFGDARARGELLAMLRPYPVESPAAGTTLTVLSEGSVVRRDTMLARVRTEGGETLEVRAPLPGKVAGSSVREGQSVAAGAELFLLAPDAEHVRDALIGLRYFGEAEDLPAVERFAGGVEGMSEEVKKQAAATAEAVRRRASGRS